MKKVLSFLSILLLSFMLVSCGKDNTQNIVKTFNSLDQVEVNVNAAKPDYKKGLDALKDYDIDLEKDVTVDDSNVDLTTPGNYVVQYKVRIGDTEIILYNDVKVVYSKEVSDATNYIKEADYSSLVNQGTLNFTLNIDNIKTQNGEDDGTSPILVTGFKDIVLNFNLSYNLKDLKNFYFYLNINLSAVQYVDIDLTNVEESQKETLKEQYLSFSGVKIDESNSNIINMSSSKIEGSSKLLRLHDSISVDSGYYATANGEKAELIDSFRDMISAGVPEDYQNIANIIMDLFKETKEKKNVEATKEEFEQYTEFMKQLEEYTKVGFVNQEMIKNTDFNYSLTDKGLSFTKEGSFIPEIKNQKILDFLSDKIDINAVLGIFKNLNITLVNKDKKFNSLTVSCIIDIPGDTNITLSGSINSSSTVDTDLLNNTFEVVEELKIEKAISDIISEIGIIKEKNSISIDLYTIENNKLVNHDYYFCEKGEELPQFYAAAISENYNYTQYVTVDTTNVDVNVAGEYEIIVTLTTDDFIITKTIKVNVQEPEPTEL